MPWVVKGDAARADTVLRTEEHEIAFRDGNPSKHARACSGASDPKIRFHLNVLPQARPGPQSPKTSGPERPGACCPAADQEPLGPARVAQHESEWIRVALRRVRDTTMLIVPDARLDCVVPVTFTKAFATTT